MSACKAWRALLIALWVIGVLSMAGLQFCLVTHRPYVFPCAFAVMLTGIALPGVMACLQVATQQHIAHRLPRSLEVVRLLRAGRRQRRVVWAAIAAFGGLIVTAWTVDHLLVFVAAVGLAIVPVLIACITGFSLRVTDQLYELYGHQNLPV